jgi:diketogulonate reductase-like aldo/keto reductase
MPGTPTPFSKSMEAMFRLQQEGKILHVGVSNVTRHELETAMSMGPVATVENLFGHAQRKTLKTPHGENRGGEEVLDICEKHEIPLVPYFSLITALPKKDDRIAVIASKYNASLPQIHLAWLLHRSPWILPIPGTSSLSHFAENLQSTEIILSEEDMQFLE